MICEPCQVPGHAAGDCDDAKRTQLMYASCPCQHRPVQHAEAHTSRDGDIEKFRVTGN